MCASFLRLLFSVLLPGSWSYAGVLSTALWGGCKAKRVKQAAGEHLMTHSTRLVSRLAGLRCDVHCVAAS
jgi:hypothetical protein